MGKTAGVAGQFNLLEQLATPNAPFRPAARQIGKEIVWRARRWLCGAAFRRRVEFLNYFPTLRVQNPVSFAILVKYGGSLLWGAMAYVLVALVMGAEEGTYRRDGATSGHGGRIVPPLSYPVTGRLSLDPGGRVIARTRLFALEHRRLRRWHSTGMAPR